MLLPSPPFCFFSAFWLAAIVLTRIKRKRDYFSLYNQNSLMENADFIWVACSCCPQEGSRCWVEGQVLLEKLLLPFPRAPSLPSQVGLVVAVSSAQRRRGTAPEDCSHGSTWEFGVAPFFFRCPWVAVLETGGLCHMPTVTAWDHDPAALETSGLWAVRCSAWPWLG